MSEYLNDMARKGLAQCLKVFKYRGDKDLMKMIQLIDETDLYISAGIKVSDNFKPCPEFAVGQPQDKSEWINKFVNRRN